MNAVLDDLFRQARRPIHNLEGWVSKRLTAVTIDGYRRRRGERGALQRPRLPAWLAEGLRYDERLMGLAVAMLEWVGVEATAGVDEWPIQTWSAQRALDGDVKGADRAVASDIETVLAAMRKRPDWYANYVERPMGRKRFPLYRFQVDVPETVREESDADDARRSELAALAVEVIAARIERGEDPRAVVVDVISDVFAAGTGAEDLGRVPGDRRSDDEWVNQRLADPVTVEGIVKVVVDLLEEPPERGAHREFIAHTAYDELSQSGARSGAPQRLITRERKSAAQPRCARSVWARIDAESLPLVAGEPVTVWVGIDQDREQLDSSADGEVTIVLLAEDAEVSPGTRQAFLSHEHALEPIGFELTPRIPIYPALRFLVYSNTSGALLQELCTDSGRPTPHAVAAQPDQPVGGTA